MQPETKTSAASASRHSPEPWGCCISPDDNPSRAFLVDEGNNFVAQFADTEKGKADCAHAARCLRALAGLNADGVKEFVAASEAYFSLNSEANRARYRAALAALKGQP